jgi:hypothetical protein
MPNFGITGLSFTPGSTSSNEIKIATTDGYFEVGDGAYIVSILNDPALEEQYGNEMFQIRLIKEPTSLTDIGGGSSSVVEEETGGYKVINTIFDQSITVGPDSSESGIIEGIAANHLIVNFFPGSNNYHTISFNLQCYDAQDTLLELYVEEFKYRRDRWYGTGRDFTKIETYYYNGSSIGNSYGVVTGPNGGQNFEGKGDFKVWSNGIIDRIEYTISNSNGNSNYPDSRSGNLKIYTFN